MQPWAMKSKRGDRKGLMNKQFNCPVCGSDRIQKVKILSRAGIPMSTEVVKQLSPPVKPTSDAKPAGGLSISIGALLLLIGFYMGTSHPLHTYRIDSFLQTMGAILGLLGVSLLALSQLEINRKKPKYKEDYDKWERLWYCSHCRNTSYDT